MYPHSTHSYNNLTIIAKNVLAIQRKSSVPKVWHNFESKTQHQTAYIPTYLPTWSVSEWFDRGNYISNVVTAEPLVGGVGNKDGKALKRHVIPLTNTTTGAFVFMP